MPYLILTNDDEMDVLENQIIATATRTVDALKSLLTEAQPLQAFAKMKFAQLGFHPTSNAPLNLIEQLNQTFTYLASVRAARWLLLKHPHNAPFRLNLGTAPGTDIVSCDGSVAAETFATVDPRNNHKLKSDINKVGQTNARLKYVFYICPEHDATAPYAAPADPNVQVVSLGW